jgi:DNA repair ATPase RecN
MLTALSIRDIVLVDALDLDVETGLTVLTGETGAGKSIILDALGWRSAGAARPAWCAPAPNRPAPPPSSPLPTMPT